MRKIIVAALVLTSALSGIVVPAGTAMAQYYDGPPRWDRRGPPPPPPERRRHNNTANAIAGGLAAGVLGGLIGGALANSGGGPRYIEAPPPPPRCWFEDRRVRNAYDGGSHIESLRVCD